MSSDDILTTSDWDTLFTKDPGRFIEALVINILYSDEDSQDREQVIVRQRRVFEKWLSLYNKSYRDIIARSVEATYKHRLEGIIAEAEVRGRISALSNLPLKKTLVAQKVDLTAVAKELRTLKSETPTK